MAYSTKIATCSYCGSRAALVLGKERHELTCKRCGAQLHDMKRLKHEPEKLNRQKQTLGHGRHKRPYDAPDPDYNKKRRKPVKRRKGLMRHLMEEAFDVIEDIFD